MYLTEAIALCYSIELALLTTSSCTFSPTSFLTSWTLKSILLGVDSFNHVDQMEETLIAGAFKQKHPYLYVASSENDSLKLSHCKNDMFENRK